MKNTSEKSIKKMNWVRWIARILSSGVILVWGSIFFSELFTSYYDEQGEFSPSEGALDASLFTVILLAGTIIGWWSEKWGGLALIVSYLVLVIGGTFLDNPAHNTPATLIIPIIMFSPFLISGILYILYWRKNKKSNKVPG